VRSAPHAANVLRLILGHGLRCAGAGATHRLAMTGAVTRLMTSILFGVSPMNCMGARRSRRHARRRRPGRQLLPDWRASARSPRAIRASKRTATVRESISSVSRKRNEDPSRSRDRKGVDREL